MVKKPWTPPMGKQKYWWQRPKIQSIKKRTVMKNKVHKNHQFGFFSLASRTTVNNRPQDGTEKYRAHGLKQKRWFSIRFVHESP